MNHESKPESPAGHITIICDNEDCRTPYVLSMDTLRAARSVEVSCKNCGEIQRIKLNKDGGIEIYHVG